MSTSLILNRSSGDDIFSGHVSIDPSVPVPLFGYASRKGIASPGLPALEANWVAYPVPGGIGLLVSLDTLFSSTELEAGIVEACAARGVTVCTLEIFASHTHFAPALDPTKRPLGLRVAEYHEEICERLAEAVTSSMTKGPSQVRRVRQGGSPAPGAVFRRARGIKLTPRPPFLRMGTQILPNPRVEIPQTCRIWVFEGEDETPLFAVASWPCHPVGRKDQHKLSADYVGALREAARRELGDALPVMFVPGASGDIRPWFKPALLSRKRLYPFPLQRSFGAATDADEAKFDAGVASAVRSALAQTRPLNLQEGIQVARHAVPLSSLSEATTEGQAQRAVEGEMGVTAINLFGLVILGLGAEISMRWLSVLGWDDAARDRILTGYTGAVFGYLPTDAQIPEGGYEVDGFRKPFGFEGRYSEKKPIDGVVGQACEAALTALKQRDAGSM